MIKRIVVSVLNLILLLMLVQQISFAEGETTESNFTWNGNSIVKYIGSDNDIIIPSRTINIGEGAFYKCSNLKAIFIPNSVTSIGSGAFNGCSGLTSITIPNSVTIIDSWAFANCTGLTELIIPDSVIRIENHSVKNCSSLKSITVQGKTQDEAYFLLQYSDIPENCIITGTEQAVFTWAIKPKYDDMGTLNDGLIPVGIGAESPRYGYLDSSGKLVIDIKYNGAGSFVSGLAPVIVEYNATDNNQSKWGYIDATGKLVLPGIYYKATEFEKMSDGNYYAIVCYPTSQNLVTINLKGEVVEPNASTISGGELFSEGLKIQPERETFDALTNCNIKKGYIDTDGKIIIPPQWGYVTPFKDGVAIVGDVEQSSTSNEYATPDLYGIIDKQGNYVLPLQKNIRFYGSFNQGFITACMDESLGLIKLNKSYIITVMLNGKKINFDQPPIVEKDRTLVPLRAIFEALGISINWDEKTQTVTAVNGDMNIKLQVGNKVSYKNRQEITLDVPAMIVNGRTLVPVRFIAESLGANVVWNEETKTVVINSK